MIKRIHHELREDDYETFKKEVEIQIRMHAERKEVIEKSYVYIKKELGTCSKQHEVSGNKEQHRRPCKLNPCSKTDKQANGVE